MAQSRKEYAAEYYQKNKESCKARTYKNRVLHPERNKEYYRKNIETYKQYYLENKEEIRERCRVHLRKLKIQNPEQIMWRAAKARAKEKGLEFNIERTDITIPLVCPALKIPLLAVSGSQQADSSPTLDRLDNSKGYIKGNVNVISGRANRIKTDATAEEVRKVADWMDSIVG